MRIYQLTESNDPTEQDIKDVAEWLNTTPDNIKVEVVTEPISKFEKNIRDMLGTYDEFPKDAMRTRKIVKAIKNGGAVLPIYVEKDDPHLFVMEGRHRMVAFLLLDMKTVPVAYVSKLQENKLMSEIAQIDEVSVMSSWIADLRFLDGSVILTLNNGRRYRVIGLSPGMFRQWVKAPSKGKFWHSNIRGNYRVSRL